MIFFNNECHYNAFDHVVCVIFGTYLSNNIHCTYIMLSHTDRYELFCGFKIYTDVRKTNLAL